jgi:hypothetical protein
MPTDTELENIRVEEADLGAEDLVLEADSDESYEVLARGVSGAPAGSVIEESIEEELMLFHPAGPGEVQVFAEATVERQHRDVHAAVREAGYRAPTLKVPPSDVYTMQNPDGGGTATVLYREGGPSMVTDGEDGTPGTKDRTVVSSARQTETIAAGETVTVDVVEDANPAVARPFPFGEDTPGNREYELQAIMFALGDGSGANTTVDSFRLSVEEREFLSTESSFVGAELASYPNADLTRLPFRFTDPPTFVDGDELSVEVQASNSGAGEEDAIINVSTVFYREAV